MVQPEQISRAEERRRLRRVTQIARSLGFVGRIEYRHLLGGTGGAQFGLAPTPENDLLVVDAEAFQKDAKPDEFSLEAIIAHERGHQLLLRHPTLVRLAARRIGLISEEILASVLGSIIAESEVDRRSLFQKGLFEAVERGMELQHAVRLFHEIRGFMREALCLDQNR